MCLWGRPQQKEGAIEVEHLARYSDVPVTAFHIVK